MSVRFVLILAGLLVLAGLAAYVYAQFRGDIETARGALDTLDTVKLDTSYGPVEFVDQGDGFPVLSIHGTGGGYDQGFALAARLSREGHRIIAPSRFGYLGTPIPGRNDAIAQADAFAEMLDRLDAGPAIVMGASAGVITALAFAARHPDRTAALLAMVPAYYPQSQSAPEPWSPLRNWAITTALRSDFLFWAGMRLFPIEMASSILATDRALIEAADPEERFRLDAVLAMILPISARADGLILDAGNTAAPPEIDLGAILAPTFIASAEDDHYRTADSARLIADGIAGAELLITPDGGHVWVGRANEVDTAAAAFVKRILERRTIGE